MKAGAKHMKEFGHKDANDEFYLLIDRLKKCSEIKYPNRLWTIDTYYSIAFEWIGKNKELENRVKQLEEELNP